MHYYLPFTELRCENDLSLSTVFHEYRLFSVDFSDAYDYVYCLSHQI